MHGSFYLTRRVIHFDLIILTLLDIDWDDWEKNLLDTYLKFTRSFIF